MQPARALLPSSGMARGPQRLSDAARASARARWLRRHPLWSALAAGLLLLVGLRLALPAALAFALERAAPRFLVGSVEIGDVDLALVRGVAVLEEVAAFEPGEEPASEAGERWLHAERLRVHVAWRPLWERTLRIRDVVLEEPFLAVARSAEGELDLGTRLREREPSPEDEADAGWRIAVESGAIRGGRIRYRDLAVGAEEELRLDLERVETRRLSLEPGSFERPGRLVVAGTIAGAPFEIDTSIAPRRDGDFALEGRVRAEQVPLARARAYVPQLGRFGDFTGRAALDLAFARVPGERETLSGTASLADFELRTEGLEQPALALRALELDADTIDLAARRAALRSLRLAGPALVVRTVPEAAVPAWDRGAEPGPAAPAAGGAPPWTWSLGTLAVDEGRASLLGLGAPVEIAFSGSAEALGPERRFPVSIELREAEGRAVLEGRAALGPPALTGTLLLEDVALPPLLRAAGLELAALRSATLGGDLALELAPQEPAAPAEGVATPSLLTLAGSLTLAGVDAAAEDPEAFSVAWDHLAAELDEVRVPLGAGSGPPELRLERLALRAPAAKLRRTGSGFVLPGAGGAPAEAPPTGAPAAGDASEAEPPVRVAIASVRIEDGALSVEDRTVQPFYREELREIDGVAEDVRWPDLRVDSLRVELAGLGDAPAEITGTIGEERVVLDVKGSRIALGPLNPYVTSYSDYAIEAGALTLNADVEADPKAYEATLGLRLHRLDLAGAEEAFERDFGVSLALGLALLRDVRGDIVLSVPVRIDREGTDVGILRVIRSALSRAILNALTTPLKLLGAVVSRGGEIEAVEPAPIPFQRGLALPSDAGRERLADLASVLVEKPALGVVLQPVVVAGELAGAAEPAPQARAAPPVSAPRDEGDGLVDQLTGWLGAGDDASETEPAPSAQAPAAPPAAPAPASAEALAQARLEAARRRLVEDFGVPAARIEVRREPVRAASGPPRVEVELAPAGSR